MKIRQIVELSGGGVAAAVIFFGASVVKADEVLWPPKLPDGKTRVVIEGKALLQPTGELRDDVKIAKTPPRVECYYYDCQTRPGKPWSVWGDGMVMNGRYYSSLGDHLSPEGNAYVYEFDPEKDTLRRLSDLRAVLNRREGWYTPGKIHSALGAGKDGWIYFSTHRGSTKVGLNKENHFEGDWMMKVNPASGESQLVAAQPVPMHCLPTGILDGERMIWYGGTADGLNKEEPRFLAYDVSKNKVLYTGERGPYRAMILSKSTGMIYFHGGLLSQGEKRSGERELFRFDPRNPGEPKPVGTRLGLRAASEETSQGIVYTVDGNELWAFDVKSEKATSLGDSAVGEKDYITSLDVDPSGRFLYYIPGAHGGAEKNGTPIVQYDLRKRTRKVICFLHPALEKSAGYIPIGSFGYALSEDGGSLFVSWNGAHQVDKKAKKVPFQSVAMTVIEIPKEERVLD
jgi:hypothetical protein